MIYSVSFMLFICCFHATNDEFVFSILIYQSRGMYITLKPLHRYYVQDRFSGVDDYHDFYRGKGLWNEPVSENLLGAHSAEYVYT